MKMIGGSTERTKMRPGPGAGGSVGAVSRASRPASTVRFSTSARSARARPGRPASLGMTADLLVQLAGDLGGEGADPRGLDGARLRDVDPPLADDAPRPRAEQDDPLAEPGRL